MEFEVWLDTLIEEKGYDLESVITVQGELYGENWIPLGCVIDAIKNAPIHEQEGIKNMIVKIDFLNGDVFDYFKQLAQALAI